MNNNKIKSVNNDQILTIDELSKYIKIPVNSLYRLAQDGKLPCRKIGKHWRFSRIAINDWLKNINNEK
jgi:excisionase family DNA binding protein